MKTMPRAEFDALQINERQKFVAEGGSVIEAPLLNKISRSEFDTLSTIERAKFVGRGGTIVDDPTPPPVEVKVTDPSVITRGEFDKMTPADQFAAVKSGRKVVDGVRTEYAWKLP